MLRHQLLVQMLKHVLDTVRVFLPKCPLTTVRSSLSADELHIVRGEAFGGKKRVHVSDLYDNNWQLF